MSVFTRASASELYTIGLRPIVVNQFSLYPWTYLQYASAMTSDKQDEKFQSMFGTDLIPKLTAETQDYPEGQIYKGYAKTLTHDEYALVLKYGQVAREDNLYNFLRELPIFLSNAMRNTIEISAANVINTLATTTGPDGVYYLATTHPCIDGTQSNKPASDVDLSYSSLSDAQVAILGRKSWENIPIVTGEKPLLVYSPSLDPMVAKLMGTAAEPFSGDNTINYLKGRFDPVMVPWMTDTDMWVIMSRPKPNGFVFFHRLKPSLRQFIDDRNDNTGIRIRARWSTGIFDWAQAILYGSVGAS